MSGSDIWFTQESLGDEFSRVLHDNLWDLYARGEGAMSELKKFEEHPLLGLVERLRDKNYLWTVPGAMREEAANYIELLLDSIQQNNRRINLLVNQVIAEKELNNTVLERTETLEADNIVANKEVLAAHERVGQLVAALAEIANYDATDRQTDDYRARAFIEVHKIARDALE